MTLVANTVLPAPKTDWLEMVVVNRDANAADKWIAEQAGELDIVITADIPLAAHCVDNGAAVLDHGGREFTEDSIGSVLASRDLLDQLRADGNVTGGPAPFQPKQRSQFLQRLDQVIHRIQRKQKP